jgi:TatD DNase family protein
MTAPARLDLVDIGANLTHDSFARDLDAVLARAEAAGVGRMVVTGASREGSRQALELARAHPGRLFATAGVHPHHALEVTTEALAALRALLAQAEVVAVGECGLDYFRDYAPRHAQQRAFERQLELAVECGKPLFLHQRDAHDDFLAILKPFLDRCGPAVVHCFTGDRRALFQSLDAGCFIGITGWLCDERRGQHLRELVAHVPADRLLVETDCPYLLPRSLKPTPKDRRNEPAFLPHIVAELARDRGEDVALTAARSTAAAEACFRLPPRCAAPRPAAAATSRAS